MITRYLETDLSGELPLPVVKEGVEVLWHSEEIVPAMEELQAGDHFVRGIAASADNISVTGLLSLTEYAKLHHELLSAYAGAVGATLVDYELGLDRDYRGLFDNGNIGVPYGFEIVAEVEFIPDLEPLSPPEIDRVRIDIATFESESQTPIILADTQGDMCARQRKTGKLFWADLDGQFKNPEVPRMNIGGIVW